VVVCLIALGGVWMVLEPTPAAKQKAEERSARPLAYQLALAERDAKANADKEDDSPKTTDIPAFDTVTTPEATPQDAAVAALPPDEGMDAPQDIASLLHEGADVQDGLPDWPDQGADASQGDPALGYPSQRDPSQDYAALPGEAGQPGAEQWGNDGRPPWAYGPPSQAREYGSPPQDGRYGPPPGDAYDPRRGQVDPQAYGPPPGAPPQAGQQAGQYGGQESTEWADQNTEEWVEVIVSGAGMRATAGDDAPMLFAFPYGRNLKVVSRFEGWVEVTDPQSAATGWMQAHALAPSVGNRPRYGQGQAYYDDQPQQEQGGGWFRRNADGFGSMINRAFGGN
jgi:hypothetical protein